ncbi:MAG TPA: aldehyde dehydrogenase family protein [Rhizomicrobium sp.]
MDVARSPGLQLALEFLSGPPKRLLIGADWLAAKSGKTFAAVNPATEETIAHVAQGAAEDVDAAVIAARRAFAAPDWSGIDPHARGAHLLRIADLVERNAEELAYLETLNNGTPISFTRGAVAEVAKIFRYYAGWPTKLYGETNPSGAAVFNYTLREPVGVCGQIIPWNGPLSMAAWKLAPALACGNTAILKPAEQTPLTALRLGELILEAGVPPGVVNIVTGFGESAGAAIAAHPGIDKVAFTGSTEVGKTILRASTGNLKRVTLELGGKSPNVVFADADIEKALASSVGAFCFLSGQVCVAGTRVFVQRSIYERFTEELTRRAAQFPVGDPLEAATMMGPLVSREQFDRVTGYFRVGLKDGASLRTGGARKGDKGFFVEPTVFADVRNGMRIAQEEIFGPVAAVIPFEDENDAILQANDTQYGLAAAVWTRDLSRAHRVGRALQAGTVWVNTYMQVDPISPFGGYKQSGIGRELGAHSIEAYTQVKSLYIDLSS